MKRIIVLLLAAVLFLCGCGTGKPAPADQTDAASESAAQSADAKTDETKTDETKTTFSETKTEATTSVEDLIAASIENDFADYPADKLYIPPAKLKKDGNFAFVFCTDTDVQDYVKMRFGPSKTHFSARDIRIPNFERVYAESVPVNGWINCSYYDGEEELHGWIRSDFVFEIGDGWMSDDGEKEEEAWMDLFKRLGYMEPGSYSGPSALRTGPGKNYPLAAELKEEPKYGYDLWVRDWTPIENGWVKVTLQLYPENPYEEELVTVGSGYVPVDEMNVRIGVGDKPVLYLYPETETDVDVTVRLAKDVYFSCTYPAYGSGWHVRAQPDGMLTDRATGKEYAYLYWELKGRAAYTFDEGFVVKGSDTAAFLEDTLQKIGLSVRERNEFIVYWLPRMQNNAYNLISFQTEAYTSLVDLQISPQPDSLLRVFMAYRALEKPTEIAPQQFAPFERTGFTAVEWGGVEVGARR